MLPSTRTPEGEPLRCSICGNVHLILFSSPPGDSVCPTCGSHAWLVEPAPESRLDSIGRQRIRLEVRILLELLRVSSSKTELAQHLSKGLVQCLAAHGSTVWLLKDSVQRKTNDLLERVGFSGETTNRQFADLVAEENQEIMRLEFGELGERLRIGVPLKNRQGLIGVIEVAQRASCNAEAGTGYVGFIRSIASVIEGHYLLQ